MPYTINKTDGTSLAVIQDGTADTSTSLTLFGKSYSNFGEAFKLSTELVAAVAHATGASAHNLALQNPEFGGDWLR